jgi:hypothetical protein
MQLKGAKKGKVRGKGLVTVSYLLLAWGWAGCLSLAIIWSCGRASVSLSYQVIRMLG